MVVLMTTEWLVCQGIVFLLGGEIGVDTAQHVVSAGPLDLNVVAAKPRNCLGGGFAIGGGRVS